MRQVTCKLLEGNSEEERSPVNCVKDVKLEDDEGYFSTYSHFSIHYDMLSVSWFIYLIIIHHVLWYQDQCVEHLFTHLWQSSASTVKSLGCIFFSSVDILNLETHRAFWIFFYSMKKIGLKRGNLLKK